MIAERSGRDPSHVAIIMDGNGRWARARGFSRAVGHRAGADAVERVVRACASRGISYLTLYAFSKENWNRPAAEVGAIMKLLTRFLRREIDRLVVEGIRLRAIGDLDDLPGSARDELMLAVERSSANRKLTLTLALSYGSRQDILEAVREIGRKILAGEVAPDDLNESAFSEFLTTAHLPPPDLLIRPGGEARLSNFLLWESAYSELYFTDTLWPDFDEAALDDAIASYKARERRFGRLDAARL